MSHEEAHLTIKKVMWVFVPIALSMGMALDLYLPSVPSMAYALNVHAVDIQLTLSIYMYTFGLGQMVWGPIVDSKGRKPAMLWGVCLYIVGSFLCAFSPTFASLIFGRFLQAFGGCAMQVSIFALIRDSLEGRTLTIALTYIKASMGIAPIVAPTIGAFVGVEFGWRMNFHLLALYGLAMMVLACFFVKAPKVQLTEIYWLKTLKAFVDIFKNKQFRFYVFMVISAQSAMFGYFSLSPLLMIKALGLTEKQFALIFGANAFMFLLSGFLIGRQIPNIGVKRSAFIASCCLLFSGILMAAFHYVIGMTIIGFSVANLIASMASSILLGAGNTGALMPFKVKAGMAAALIGILEFMCGGLIGSTVVYWGVISDLSLAGILIVMGALAVGYGKFYSDS